MAILTAAGIGAAIVAALGTAKEIATGAVKVVVIVASIAFAITFAAAIVVLFNYVSTAIATSIVGEVFGIVSMCLPFSMFSVWGAILIVLEAALLFLIAKKTWELVSNLVSFAK